MKRVILLLCIISTLCLVFTGCGLQKDTYEILYSIPTLTEDVPEIPQTTVSANNQPPQPSSQENVLVWIPKSGGSKYHERSTCSGMVEPQQVTMTEAINQGYTHCKKCYSELD